MLDKNPCPVHFKCVCYIFVILQYLCGEFVIINNIFYKRICKKGWGGGKEKNILSVFAM